MVCGRPAAGPGGGRSVGWQRGSEARGGAVAGRTARRRVVRVTLSDGGGPGEPPTASAAARADLLAAEEPLGIRVNGAALTLTMRTPGDDIELAAGFLVGEAIVAAADDILGVIVCDGTTCGHLDHAD